LTRITSTLHEELRTFTIVPRSVLLRIGKISEKNCTENQNTFNFKSEIRLTL